MPDWLWVLIFVLIAMGVGFVFGYFVGRSDERKWNAFYYSYGHFDGRRQERRRHRD